jgi:hypothetical protein
MLKKMIMMMTCPHACSHQLLGSLLCSKPGAEARGRELLKRAIELSPNNVDLLVEMAQVCLLLRLFFFDPCFLF